MTSDVRMTSEAPRRPRIQHVTTAGTALAVTLLPLVVGVLLARTMAADPMTTVNALVTNGGHRPRVSPKEWRRCGGHALRRLRTAERVSTGRPGARRRRPAGAFRPDGVRGTE
ncbi:hypothetical protein [Streptomyces sp. WZ.A104]|uniref:hypothetical protein n=1 Tax=Streptomyces sp. WZ.A104 TaxID=2023771 RepID=UPI00211C2EFF